MSKLFIPSTQAKDSELGTIETDRRGRTWVVTDVSCRGGGTRRIWKLQKSDDGFVLVEEGGALSTSCVEIPEEVQIATEKQRRRERLGKHLDTAKGHLATGAGILGSGAAKAAGKGLELGKAGAGILGTGAVKVAGHGLELGKAGVGILGSGAVKAANHGLEFGKNGIKFLASGRLELEVAASLEVLGTGAVKAAGHGVNIGSAVGNWLGSQARTCGDKISEWMSEPPTEEFEMLSIAGIEDGEFDEL